MTFGGFTEVIIFVFLFGVMDLWEIDIKEN